MRRPVVFSYISKNFPVHREVSDFDSLRNVIKAIIKSGLYERTDTLIDSEGRRRDKNKLIANEFRLIFTYIESI